jgi:FxsC-like protein
MTGGADPRGQEFPLFFLSYAHAHWDDAAEQHDADYWVRKFHDNLCSQIEALAKLPSGQEPPGFMDRRLRLGDDWPDELAKRLAQCSVFVPLYTTRYFHRPDCGREWSVIRRRQDMHIAAFGRSPNIVIPVIWSPIRPEDIPAWARSIHYDHETLSPIYHERGLESLLRLRNHHDEYLRIVHTIAKRIVEVAQGPGLRPLLETPRFQSLPDAFADDGDPVGANALVRITVAALTKHSELAPGRSALWYGETAEEWCPYRDGSGPDGQQTPVAWRAFDVAQRRDFDAVVTELSTRSEELRPKARPSAPTVLLIDAWTALDEHWQALLAKLDMVLQGRPWIRVILPWNSDDTETKANAAALREALKQVLGNSMAGGRIPSRRGEPGPTSSAAFGPAVSDAIRASQAEFMKQAEKYLPNGPYPRKPKLRGPGGSEAKNSGEESDDRQ